MRSTWLGLADLQPVIVLCGKKAHNSWLFPTAAFVVVVAAVVFWLTYMLTYQASLTCCCLGREPIRFLSSLPGSAMASSPNAMKRPASAEAEAEPDIAKKRRVFSGVQDEAHLAGSSDDDTEGCTVFHITRGLTGHATTVRVASSANVAKIVEALRSQMGLRANASLILVCGDVALSGTEFVAQLPSTRLQVIVAKESTFEMVGPEMVGSQKYGAGTVGANGKIYFAPCRAAQVLCIDPQEETVEMVGPEMVGPVKYRAAGTVGANGQIYLAPYTAAQVLCINP